MEMIFKSHTQNMEALGLMRLAFTFGAYVLFEQLLRGEADRSLSPGDAVFFSPFVAPDQVHQKPQPSKIFDVFSVREAYQGVSPKQ